VDFTTRVYAVEYGYRKSEKEYAEKIENLPRLAQRSREALLRFNMFTLGEYRYEDFGLEHPYEISDLERRASPTAREHAKHDILEVQEATSWMLNTLRDYEAQEKKTPRAVFLRIGQGEIWGWNWPEEYSLIFELWADFDGLHQVDIIPMKLEAEKTKDVQTYGRAMAILENLYITALEELGYSVK
jgi:hypothetical protein